MNHLIAPSILAADFGNLERDSKMVNQSKADWFHIDIMDGVFVPNISFGFPVLKSIQNVANKPLDVHLMIVNPERYIKEFRDHGTHVLTVHYEACTHLHRTIQNIKEEGMKAGVAINPHTTTRLLEDVLHEIDLVCLMSVNPGFGGQKFINHTYKKIEELNTYRKKHNLSFLIEIDGGVTLDNAALLLEKGADVLVAGSTVFSSIDPMETISKLKDTVANTISI